MDYEGAFCFAYQKEQTDEGPTFLFFADGLKGVKYWAAADSVPLHWEELPWHQANYYRYFLFLSLEEWLFALFNPNQSLSTFSPNVFRSPSHLFHIALTFLASLPWLLTQGQLLSRCSTKASATIYFRRLTNLILACSESSLKACSFSIIVYITLNARKCKFDSELCWSHTWRTLLDLNLFKFTPIQIPINS